MSSRFAHWMKFMNQDTPVLHGPEKYSKTYNYPVVFVHIRKVKRGFYEVVFTLIEEEPMNSKPGEITEKFMHLLEHEVQENPQYYLWTHNRWKFTRPEKHPA